jgi:hypothetical protein
MGKDAIGRWKIIRIISLSLLAISRSPGKVVEVEVSPQYHYRKQPQKRLSVKVVEWKRRESSHYIFPHRHGQKEDTL